MKDLLKAYQYATIYPTKACTLSCPRCYWKYSGSRWKDYKGMTWATFGQICDSIRRQNIHLIEMTFSGGEPTLWPSLVAAMQYVKRNDIADRIRVVTNAVGRTEEDYLGADIVQISDYGALNRKEWYELSKSKKFKCIQNKVIHLPWPFPGWQNVENALPAECNCALLAYCGDRVYPCGFSSTMDVGGMSIEEDYYQKMLHGDPYNSELCRKCLSNQLLRTNFAIPPTVEWSVWDCSIGGKIHFRGKGFRLRKIYNVVRRFKDKKIAAGF